MSGLGVIIVIILAVAVSGCIYWKCCRDKPITREQAKAWDIVYPGDV